MIEACAWLNLAIHCAYVERDDVEILVRGGHPRFDLQRIHEQVAGLPGRLPLAMLTHADEIEGKLSLIDIIHRDDGVHFRQLESIAPHFRTVAALAGEFQTNRAAQYALARIALEDEEGWEKRLHSPHDLKTVRAILAAPEEVLGDGGSATLLGGFLQLMGFLAALQLFFDSLSASDFEFDAKLLELRAKSILAGRINLSLDHIRQRLNHLAGLAAGDIAAEWLQAPKSSEDASLDEDPSPVIRDRMNELMQVLQAKRNRVPVHAA